MAMILDASVGRLVDKLIDLAAEKTAMVLGVKDELTKLQRRMVRIQKFLESAERRRLEDEPALQNWVRELKDVAYDADDIIDLCRIHAAHQPSSSKRTPVCFNFTLFSCFSSSVPHRYQISSRIRSLTDKLEEIYKDRSHFNLEESSNQTVQPITSVNTRQTSSLVEFDAVGNEIEVATDELVKLIVQEQGGKCRVFAITGMGGIGKTTLAQKIYNNNNIQTEFQIKVWVCVSQSYNEIDLLQQVIRGVGGHYGQATTKSELLPVLQSTVREKRVLFLVLDDVWRADVWADLLRNPLQGADAIVRILVTTRDNNVAMEMGAVHTHPVKQLSNSTCWEMLCRKVFTEGREEEIRILADIGMQIVEKCAGLPLAIKTIAGVLAKKGASRRIWENVLKNEAWSMSHLPEELRGSLYLSYDDLPSPLKQCFVYCSLFPEDYRIDRDDLVRLWVAEGFVKEKKNSLVEDIAEEYYNELITRNLLQPFPFYNDARKCIMHDLLRSLAKHLSQDESFSGESAASTTSSTKLRRISIEKNQENILTITGVIVEQKCLRTLLAFSRTDQVLNDNLLVGLVRLRVLLSSFMDIQSIPNSIGDLIHLRYLNFDHTNIRELPDSTGNLTNLKFLSLRYCRSIETLPKSIGDLIHLRYLNLEHTNIRELPDSIGNLTNLQFLNLCSCRYIETLPKGITQLHNLRQLDLYDTQLSFIPKGIEKLQKLNELSGFVVASPGDQGHCSGLEELSSLYQLRMLSISKFERAQKGALSLQKLDRLVELKLLHTDEEDGGPPKTDEEITQIEDVFEELCPSRCLEHLSISGFFGKQYPRWMQSPFFGACLPFLTELYLVCNQLCPQLPPAGELPQLRILYVEGAAAVKSIGSEFLGVGVRKGTDATETTAFPNLESLRFWDMPNLENWTFDKEMDGMEQQGMQAQASPKIVLLRRLNTLTLYDCPKLKALPKGLKLSAMKSMFIQTAHSLTEVNNLPNLRELMLDDNYGLERISHLPALQVLVVKYCPALKYVEKMDALQRLELEDNNMEGLPGWLLKLLEERKPDDYDNDDFLFQLNCSERALQRCLKGGPDWSIIECIPRVSAGVIDAKGFLRYTKKPYNYDTNL